MLPQILTATLHNCCTPLFIMAAFGAYHGLNPGMGWLFALSLLVVAMAVVASAQFLPASFLKFATALTLMGFGLYKIFNYYRHPRWVGMQVGMGDLTWWSFLMATAHGAGLMIIPTLVNIIKTEDHTHYGSLHSQVAAGGSMALVIALHT